MTSTLNIVILSALFCMVGCHPPSEAEQQQNLEVVSNASELKAEITIARKATAIGPLSVGMTAEEVESLQSPFMKKNTNIEGDDYTIYVVSISDQSTLEGMLNYEGEVYSITTSSKMIRDEFGNGVDSTLEDLQKSYPNGRLIRGMADGNFLNLF